MSTQTPLEKLERNFKNMITTLLKQAHEKLELDKAMGDELSAQKEEIKIKAVQTNLAFFEQAKTEQTIDAFKTKFFRLLRDHKAKIGLAIETAKQSENKEELVHQQIQHSVIIGPIEQTFMRFYEAAKKAK